MSVQQTLAGDEADSDRVRPDTLVACPECGDVIFRRERWDHPHDVFATSDDGDGDEEEEEDEPERVGSLYDITLEYTVTYRFRVPAWSEHEAKERAEDLQLDARPADSYQVHSEDREVKTIMSDDAEVPDDYDPYGSTMLWEVYGNDGD